MTFRVSSVECLTREEGGGGGRVYPSVYLPLLLVVIGGSGRATTYGV